MPDQTLRLKITKPLGIDDANVPPYVRGLADYIDANAMIYSSGAIADRPVSTPETPGIDGRIFFAKDEGRVYIDGGTGWTVLDGGLPGEIRMHGGSTAPSGWVWCDGAEYSRSTYSVLFGVVGSTFGAGNGSTTFNVPDLRGRVPLGAGSAPGLTARTTGAKAGAESVPLTIGHLPSHNHGGSTWDAHAYHNHGGWTNNMNQNAVHAHGIHGVGDHQHYHGRTNSGNIVVNGGTMFGVNAGAIGVWTDPAGSHTHGMDAVNLDHLHGIPPDYATHRHPIPAEGGNAGHENMPPFLVLRFIIKTGL